MEDFIEINQGLWYETNTGLPYSSKKSCGPKGYLYNGPLKRLIAKDRNGYHQVWLDGKMVYWHRLVYSYFHGPIPCNMQVDHINNKRDDNRIENLQILTAKENYRCQLKNKMNTSGFPGVYWLKKNRKWMARIMVNGIRKNLGCYDEPQDAYKAYLAAKIKFHGKESIRALNQHE